MNIKITREIVKEIAGVRRTLKVGQVIDVRDPDAASLIKHGYAELFQDETNLIHSAVEAAREAFNSRSGAKAAPATEEPTEDAGTDDKPVKRLR